MNNQMHYLYSVFYSGFSGFIIVFPIILVDTSLIHVKSYDRGDIILLSLASITETLGQLFLSLSLKFEEASKVSPLLYLTILFGFLSDILLFRYKFSFLEILGTFIIVVPILCQIYF